MSTTPIESHGQLCIWTDTDPQAETDFNAWYDREHMQERVAIPGFLHARRFLANDGGARRYLALYVTVTLDVFRSDAYREAFTLQTDWSLRNFARMRDNQRRVGELVLEAGAGEGCHVALCVAPAHIVENAAWRQRVAAGAVEPGVHAVRVFRTDTTLSSPLATGDGKVRPPAADALVLVEGSVNEAARAVAATLAEAAGVAPTDVRSFNLLWRLAA